MSPASLEWAKQGRQLASSANEQNARISGLAEKWTPPADTKASLGLLDPRLGRYQREEHLSLPLGFPHRVANDGKHTCQIDTVLFGNDDRVSPRRVFAAEPARKAQHFVRRHVRYSISK